MIISLLFGSALAAGMHAGVPVQGVDALGAPTFLAADTGWEAPVLDADGQPRGVARVFVAPTAAAAAAWVEDAARTIQSPLKTVSGLGDHALQAAAVVIVQDGNVALSVSLHDDDATPIARALVDAIVDSPAGWPAAPTMRQADGLTFFDAPDAVELTVIGGRRPLGQPDGFVDLPSRVIAWDAWGRPAVVTP